MPTSPAKQQIEPKALFEGGEHQSVAVAAPRSQAGEEPDKRGEEL